MPDVTSKVYAHLFHQALHADKTRAAMEESFGAVLTPAPDGTTALVIPTVAV